MQHQKKRRATWPATARDPRRKKTNEGKNVITATAISSVRLWYPKSRAMMGMRHTTGVELSNKAKGVAMPDNMAENHAASASNIPLPMPMANPPSAKARV
jgi:hypothetical protein